MPKAGQTNSDSPKAITGIQAMQGAGVKQARGFWAEAWSQVIRRFSAIVGLSWLGIVAFFAVFAPVIANGHPLRMVTIEPDGDRVVTSPLLQSFTAADWLLLIATVLGAIFLAVPIPALSRSKRVAWIVFAMLAGTVPVLLSTLIKSDAIGTWFFGLPDTIRALERDTDGNIVGWYKPTVVIVAAIIGILVTVWIPFTHSVLVRLGWLTLAAAVSAGVVHQTWTGGPNTFTYSEQELAGTIETTYTLIPWSPTQEPSDRNTRVLSPGQTDAQALRRNFDNDISNHLDSQPRKPNDPFGPQGFDLAKQVAESQQWPDQAKTQALAIIERLEENRPGTSKESLMQTLRAELDAAGEPQTAVPLDAFETEFSEKLSGLKRRLTDPFGPAGFRIARSVLERQPLPEEVKTRLAVRIDDLEAEMPGATREDLRARLLEELAPVGQAFPLGTDNKGVDMLSQLLHACRLSISIGLVSTGISLIIGITVGSLMGYFGGWVDLVLYRFVEIFMAIPVLFLLIVAAGVLPKNIYVMMIIIGCFSWMGAARFVRAEFLKLRNMDFVQSARATGLPLRSILFKHMLPNGVTPVLVESSFAIAAAILAEATLSYLGLGPDKQASWGKLLASATGQSGEFFWWLAIFPGMAIFLTVLSYNLIGEALRDAIDPKLKKARV